MAALSENRPISDTEDLVTFLKPAKGWLSIDFKELWRYRELIYFLTWRDIKVRYKQAVLGIAWAVLQPLMTMLIFTVIFGTLLKTPSQGIPYPLFSLTALLPWQLFASALQRSSTSLVGNANLLTKIYFPRLAIPLASIFAALVDFLNLLCGADRRDGLLPLHAGLECTLGALAGVVGPADGIGRGALAFRAQCPISGYSANRSLPDPGVDVCLAYRLSH